MTEQPEFRLIVLKLEWTVLGLGYRDWVTISHGKDKICTVFTLFAARVNPYVLAVQSKKIKIKKIPTNVGPKLSTTVRLDSVGKKSEQSGHT